MRIIIPYQITEAMMLASNVPENDYPAWNAATNYSADTRVIHNHRIYRWVAASTGKDPAEDTTSTYWLDIGATNRWRAFDSRLGSVTARAETVSYSIRLGRTQDSIAFFGLSAQRVNISAKAPGAASPFFSRTIELAERGDIINAWTYFFDEFTFKPDLVITGVNLPSGTEMTIAVDAESAAAQVSEIIIGRNVMVGTTGEGTGLGIVDYSIKERDEWGGVFIVPRPVTKTVDFRFAIDTENAAEVQKVMERASNRVCVFFSGEGQDMFGTTVLGILRDYDLTLTHGFSQGSATVESLA